MYDILERCFGVQKLFSDFWGKYLFCACSLYAQIKYLNTPIYPLPLPPPPLMQNIPMYGGAE